MVESEDIIERDWTFQQSSSGILGMLLVLDRDRRVIFTGTELEFVVKYSLPECLIMFNAAESIAVTHFPSVDKTLVVNECFRTLEQWQMPDTMNVEFSQRPRPGIFFLHLVMKKTECNGRAEGDFWPDCLVEFLFQWLTGSDLVPYISAHKKLHKRYDEKSDRRGDTKSLVVPKGFKPKIVALLETDVAPFDNRKTFEIWELELMPESKIVQLIKSRVGAPQSSMEDDDEIWDEIWWDSEAWQTDEVCGDNFGASVEIDRCIKIDDIPQYTNTRPPGRLLYVSQQLEIAKTWTNAQTISIKRQRTITRQWHDAMHALSLIKDTLITPSNRPSHREMHREILNLFQLSLLQTSS